MRIKTGLSLFTMLFIALVLVFTGCAGQGGSTGGSIVLNLQIDMSKTVVPDVDMSVASYDIVGNGPGYASFVLSNHSTSSAAFNDLAEGAWSVVVYARNAGGTVIAMGSAAVSVNEISTTFVTITVTPLSGNGTLSIIITYSGLSDPLLEGTLTTPGGYVRGLSNISYGSGSASWTDSSLPAGYYILSLFLKNSGVPVWGAAVAVRILAGETTLATHTEGSSGGSIDLSIDHDLQNSIAVTLSGVQNPLPSGTDMTVVAAPGEAVDSYAWYLDGVLLAGETASTLTIGSALSDGNYRIDVLVRKGDIFSSTNANFTIAGPVPPIKKVYSEHAEGTDIALDTAWQVWDATVTSFNELSAPGADSGTAVIQVVPEIYGHGWFGHAIRSESKTEDLSGYNYLIVNLKTTDMSSTVVEIGVGTPSTDEHWFVLNMLGKTDGLWHKFVIDVSAVNLSSVDWVFAMRNRNYISGTVEFDDVHYSTVDPGDGEQVIMMPMTIMKVYSELTGVEIPMDTAWQIWSGTITTFNELTEYGADAGSKIIQVVPNPGSGWFGYTIRTESHAENLYGNNYLVFSLRTTDMNSTAIEIGVGTPATDEHWFSADMTGKTDGAWHQFVIDVSAVNLASVDWMFAMRHRFYTGGNVDFDNVYYTPMYPLYP